MHVHCLQGTSCTAKFRNGNRLMWRACIKGTMAHKCSITSGAQSKSVNKSTIHLSLQNIAQ